MTEKSLDQLKAALQEYLTREATNRQDWVEIQMGKCLTLVDMRDKFEADKEFGQWFDANFGDAINREARWRAIAMGRHPDALRACLTATKRASLHMIHQEEFSRFQRTLEPTKPDNKEIVMPRRDANLDQGKTITNCAQDRGKEGITTAEIVAEFGYKHQSASKRITLLKQEGVLYPTGEKRRFGNGMGDVLVHRDFVTTEIRRAKKDKARGRKPSGPSAPINRAAMPLYSGRNLEPEEKGPPMKYGNSEIIPIKERDLMEKQKIAARLAPQLSELEKKMAAFLSTPAEQAAPIVPMPPDEFVAAVTELSTGPRLRRKVEESLETFIPVLNKVTTYIAALKAALETAPVATTQAPAQRDGQFIH